MEPGGLAEVELASSRLAALLTRYVPGLVSSLNVVGSAADGDFRPGSSDLDFVAVVTRPLGLADLEALTIVHRLYRADPTLATLDGIWITEQDLASGPDRAAAGPSTHDGTFVASARGNRNPITWLMLRTTARTIQGSVDRDAVWWNEARLKSWLRENVEAYWVPWLAQAENLMSVAGLRLLGGDAVMWGVLGISRVHCTLHTGSIASKLGAAQHALDAFAPRWHPILKESIRLRRGTGSSEYRNVFRRRRDALAYVGMVIEAIRADHLASE